MFISTFTDQSVNLQYGVRYYLDQTSDSNNTIFQTRSDGPCYQLDTSTIVTWGGKDPYLNSSLSWIQYVRVYLGWVADSADKMTSLALMDPDGILKHDKCI